MKRLLFSSFILPIAVLGLLGTNNAVDGQAVQYSGKPRILNVGKLILDSSTYQGNIPAGLNRQAEDTAPYIFYLMDLRSDLKPRGWVLQNPLAPTTVTQAIRDRWITIDPTGGHAIRYTVGSPVTKDMAAYWEVRLVDTPLNDLLKFDLLFISSHTPGEVFSPQEQAKLRKLVQAGGIVWLDDCWKFRISDAGRFFLPDVQFHGTAIGKANPNSYGIIPDPTHPLLTTPYTLTQNEVNRLGDKDVGGYYHTGFVPPGQVGLNPPFTDTTPATPPNGGQPQPNVLAPVVVNAWSAGLTGGPYPYISAGQYGSGYIVVTSGDVGDAINTKAAGTTGYEIPAPDYDKNGGSVCGNNLLASDPEDLKFAYNVLTWASNFATYRRGPQHSAYAPQSVTLPLARQWQYALQAGEAVESDPILLRSKVFVATTQGRLLCFLQDPAQFGATVQAPLWQGVSPSGALPFSSITLAEVATVKSGTIPLLMVSAGSQVFAYNASYNPNIGGPNQSPVWAFTVPFPQGDRIAGPPVYMDGSVFVTTQTGGVWEFNPADGSPTRSVVMPTDKNNPSDILPPTEPILHFANPKWGYIAAPPAVGYVVDRLTTPDDSTLVLSLYTTATQLNQAPNAPRGNLLQLPIRVANEHYTLSQGSEFPDVNNQPGPWLVHTLNYSAAKNPELVQVSINGGKLVTTPVGVQPNGPAGSGTMHVSIQWPDGTQSPSYYSVDNTGNMQSDYNGGGQVPDGKWIFFAPKANPPTIRASTGNRIRYMQIVLGPNQYKQDPVTGQYSIQPMLADCSVHIDYDVDLGDPFGAQPASDGPGVHPELGIFDVVPPTNTPAGSAALSPPAIGLDDSVYFGTEDGVLYSVGHYGATGLGTNWKYYANKLLWFTSDGKSLNPVTLADSSNIFRTDVQTVPGNVIIRSTPTVGNGRVYITTTDTANGSNQSRLLALDTFEFQQSSTTTTNTGAGQASGGVPVSFHLRPDLAPPNNVRNPLQPVAMLAQFDPLTNQFQVFYLGANDFVVDPDTQTVTINRFGRMYANLPIYVFYNLANGQIHSLKSNPPSPPDEVHNVLPGVNGVWYDASQKYLFPQPNSLYFQTSTTYAGPGPINGVNHPEYRFPDDQICNLLWQFPDPVWNNGGVDWTKPVDPNNPGGNPVVWNAPVLASGMNSQPLVQPFTGAPIGAPPTLSIADSSPALVGDSLLLGISQLTAPFSQANGITSGFMALSAEPRNGLQGYTTPENVGIYNYLAVQQAAAGSFPTGISVNNPNGVVAAALANQNNANVSGALLAPYPPNVSYYSTQDFKGQAGLISTPAVTSSGAVIGAGVNNSTGAGSVTMLGSPTTIALDSYRLVGLDAGGNIAFEIPSTSKTTLLGADEPEEEGVSTPGPPGQFHTTTEPFNRPSAMQRVNNTNVVIADTGNDRVVECDLGGNVVSEITRYFDPGKPYQPDDIYLVAPGDNTVNPPVPASFSVGNVHLNAPTDVSQWYDTTIDATGNTILNTYRLIVDGGSSQVVEIQDSIYLTGPNTGQFVTFQTMTGPDGTQVKVRWYHIKVWGTQASPSGAEYHYRNAVPYLVSVNNASGQHQVMPFVFATISNYGLLPPLQAGQAWREQLGASIVVLYGPTDAAGNLLPPAVQGALQATAMTTLANGKPITAFNDSIRPDKVFGSLHSIQNPAFLRPYFDGSKNIWHLLYIDQGAFYSPTGQDTRQGNWGVYDLTLPGPPGSFAGAFYPQVVGSLDDFDYNQLTASPDLFYASTPPFAPPTFEPTSVEYLPLTNTVLISNGSLNQLADPTRLITDPQRLLGPGGEVFLVDGAAFYHLKGYTPDNSAAPSIQFRSIPVQGSYLLQQVVAADRR